MGDEKTRRYLGERTADGRKDLSSIPVAIVFQLNYVFCGQTDCFSRLSHSRGPKLFRFHRFFLFVFLIPSNRSRPPAVRDRPFVRPSIHRRPESGFSTPTSSSFSPLPNSSSRPTSPLLLLLCLHIHPPPAVRLSYGIISLMSSTSLLQRKSTKARGIFFKLRINFGGQNGCCFGTITIFFLVRILSFCVVISLSLHIHYYCWYWNMPPRFSKPWWPPATPAVWWGATAAAAAAAAWPPWCADTPAW